MSLRGHIVATMAQDRDEVDEGGSHAPGGLYRLDSNQSSTSIFEDVEMAHDEVCFLTIWFTLAVFLTFI